MHGTIDMRGELFPACHLVRQKRPILAERQLRC